MAPFDRRDFSGNAVPTTTTGTIGPGDLTVNIASSTGWPEGDVGPFIVTLDAGLATEEKVEVLSRTGLVLTITPTGRGHDNTAAVGHSAGSKIEHTASARDLAEANQHIADDTMDHHGQYLTPARHMTEVHVISTAELEDGSVTYGKLAAGQRWEPGDFKWGFQTADHTGWLIMDGRNNLSRTTYAALFAVVGTSMGNGVDGNTFAISNMAKRTVLGKAPSGTASTLGGTGGTADAVVPTHAHSIAHTHSGTTGDQDRGHTHAAENHNHWVNGVGNHSHQSSRGDHAPQLIAWTGSSEGFQASSNGLRGTSDAGHTVRTSDDGGHDHGWTGGHANHSGGQQGASQGHLHGFTTGGSSAGNTGDTGVSGTDQNLPPYLVLNAFIHI